MPQFSLDQPTVCGYPQHCGWVKFFKAIFPEQKSTALWISASTFPDIKPPSVEIYPLHLLNFPCKNNNVSEYKESEETRELKSEIAQQKLRDEEGHFVHTEQPTGSFESNEKPAGNPISKFFSEHTHYSKSQDDLIDLHVGNPLRRIALLLEDIKRQKAFNFTLKGSLGIMGVLLTLSVFGIFGGGQVLCERGTQVEIGTVRQLQIVEEDPSTGIPVLAQILDYFRPVQKRPKFVLIKNDESVIQLPYSRNVDLTKFTNPISPDLGQKVIATGNYNSCSQTLTVKNPLAVEPYNK